IKKEAADIYSFQETKAQQGQAVIDLPEYTEYWNSAQRKGYSGTAIFAKTPAIKTDNFLNAKGKALEVADKYGDANLEGRVLTAEFEHFYLVNVYTPNSKPDLSRLEFRHKVWDPTFLKYLK